jgi:DNA-binding NarL/FixJ family response regulator
VKPRGVVVAHREALVAEGIAAALGHYPGIAAVGVATTAADAERLGERADAVALDQLLPGAEDAASRLRKRGARVVFLGEAAGADDGIRVSMDASVAALASALVPGTDRTTDPRLTRRQQEILALVARGLPGKQVARHLGISPKTVEHHKSRIFARLGVANQTAASVAVAHQLGRSHPWTRSST